jgi:hypothetical protein
MTPRLSRSAAAICSVEMPILAAYAIVETIAARQASTDSLSAVLERAERQVAQAVAVELAGLPTQYQLATEAEQARRMLPDVGSRSA